MGINLHPNYAKKKKNKKELNVSGAFSSNRYTQSRLRAQKKGMFYSIGGDPPEKYEKKIIYRKVGYDISQRTQYVASSEMWTFW